MSRKTSSALWSRRTRSTSSISKRLATKDQLLRSHATLETARDVLAASRARVRIHESLHVPPHAMQDLPADFGERYQSAFLDLGWLDVADPDLVGKYYNWTPRRAALRSERWMHGVCTISTTRTSTASWRTRA